MSDEVKSKPYDEQLQDLLCKMTNYQRMQYTRIKRAGHDVPISIVEQLAAMPHHKDKLHATSLVSFGPLFARTKDKKPFKERAMDRSPNYVSA